MISAFWDSIGSGGVSEIEVSSGSSYGFDSILSSNVKTSYNISVDLWSSMMGFSYSFYFHLISTWISSLASYNVITAGLIP